ncbi:hypothetical protein TWF281_000206 [Arthrobotrys megalospora]
MPRAAQLLVSRTAKPDIPAHWSLYVPYASSNDTGKLIHVVGSPLYGFMLEFKAPYVPAEDSIKRVSFPLCTIEDEHIRDTESYELVDGGRKTVVMAVETARCEDELELIAMAVDVPEKTKGWNPLVPAKVGDKNCQWWMREYVDMLVKEGVFTEEAYANLAKVPETWSQFKEDD